MYPQNKPLQDLTDLASDKVLVLNNYTGCYDSKQISKYPVVIYTCFGEMFGPDKLRDLISCAPETFFIFVTTQKYLDAMIDPAQGRVFYVPSCYAQYSSYLPPAHFDIADRHFCRRFLSLNFRAQWNRQALAQFLYQTGLIDDFYFSYHAHDKWQVGSHTLYHDINQIIGTTWFNQQLDLEKFYQLLPITTGLQDPLQNLNDWSFGLDSYYTETLCSFVNETYIDQNHDPFFTEKVFKPLAYGHPFLLFSSAGALYLLRSLGFETFDPIIDESYDNEESPQLRFEMLLREVQRICQMPQTEIERMHSGLISKLSHNRETFWRTLPSVYATEIQTIKSDIRTLYESLL